MFFIFFLYEKSKTGLFSAEFSSEISKKDAALIEELEKSRYVLELKKIDDESREIQSKNIQLALKSNSDAISEQAHEVNLQEAINTRKLSILIALDANSAALSEIESDNSKDLAASKLDSENNRRIVRDIILKEQLTIIENNYTSLDLDEKHRKV